MIEQIRSDLDRLRSDFQTELASAGDEEQLQRVRSSYLGPKGRVTLLLKGLGQLPSDVRPLIGKEANLLRETITSALGEELSRRQAARRDDELKSARLDLTLAGRRAQPRGGVHPVNRVIRELSDLFLRMGFEVAGGPEVELDWYNFEALNFPPDHPARDMQDTFFVRPPDARGIKELVLRTHTSPVQIRALGQKGVPIRVIAPGRVYRCDSDATHSPMFHQIEGLWVDEGVSFAHLKGVITAFISAFFGERGVRFRPSFFPFVEPGAEVDMQCMLCNGAGCRLCKGTGWIEILGAGMVHPNVLEACKIDSERYTGFAFGLGIDRIAMVRWAIDDLAHLFRGDLRFLEQI
ncbi:MAG: phenylalanine--tRNA ligase subunit alpha [Deltaproteobacteria bacterium]|nr:phenylalanine--tRNA ligase subunit alpha [Deltaproteobacteria bacterium]